MLFGFDMATWRAAWHGLPFSLPSPSVVAARDHGVGKVRKQRISNEANHICRPTSHHPSLVFLTTSCDTLENVSKKALGLMAQAALYAITKLGKAGNLREWLADTEAAL